MARVLNGSQFYLHTPRSSANGMNHIPERLIRGVTRQGAIQIHVYLYLYLTCFFLLSRSWSSFADPGGMECWVGLDKLITEREDNSDWWVSLTSVRQRLIGPLRPVISTSCPNLQFFRSIMPVIKFHTVSELFPQTLSSINFAEKVIWCHRAYRATSPVGLPCCFVHCATGRDIIIT